MEPSRPRVVLFIGDSLTASGYWKQITLPGATLKGKGWPGKQLKSIIDGAGPLLTEHAPTDVVLLGGVTDLMSGHTATRTKADLATAWATLAARGVPRVWAVQLTPWAGNKLMADATRGPTLREATAEVNAFIAAQAGQPGGPSYVIKADALGDADGKLLKPYSHDGLRLTGKGEAALAQIVQNALATVPTAAGPAVVGGEDLDRAVRYAVEAWTDRLNRNDIPPASTRVDGNAVIFGFYTGFRKQRADELLPSGTKYGGQYVYARTEVIASEAAVGADVLPAHARAKATELTARLAAQDAAPTGWRWDADTLYALFYTPFRRERAIALLPPSYAADGRTVYVSTDLVRDAQVGQVVGTAQSTPWTCGPAALRAVLAHHGTEVGEDELAVLAGNAPVIGCTPAGLIRAATELGYRADCFCMRSPAALAAFLARDLPVMLVVDSFTQPGRAGHWVVATALEGDSVRIMDPHAPTRWRRLPRTDLDARWWHREGGHVVRRLALVMTPTAEARVGGARYRAGADAPPAHGRLAKCTKTGWDKVGLAFGKVWRAGMKTMVNAVGGGKLGTAAVDAWADKFHLGVKNLKAEERANFFNTASNEEVFIWSVGWARDGYDKLAKDHGSGNGKKAWKFVTALDIDEDDLHGDLVASAHETLMTLLWYGQWAPMAMPPCMNQAAIQAHLILFYGPLADTWEIVRKKRQLPKGDSLVKITAWVNAIMADLDAYRAARGDSPQEFA